MQDIHWVYQKRDVERPWALQVFHVYSKRKASNQSLDGILYSELIDNETNSVAVELDAGRDFEGMLQALCLDMGKYVEVTGEDYMQLEAALGDIVNR